MEAQWQGQSETAVVRLQQLPADPGADTAENMNRLVLLSGRMPEAPDECVVHVMGYGDPVEPGTVLTLPEDTEHVSRKQFTTRSIFPRTRRAAPPVTASWMILCSCRRAA